VLDQVNRLQRPTWPSTRQDLLFIHLSDAETACAILAEEVPSGVEWGARVHGGMSGLILAPAPSESERNTLRVIDALGELGPRIQELHLSGIMAPGELRAWCADGGRELPAG
jgi:hypothetical protein